MEYDGLRKLSSALPGHSLPGPTRPSSHFFGLCIDLGLCSANDELPKLDLDLASIHVDVEPARGTLNCVQHTSDPTVLLDSSAQTYPLKQESRGFNAPSVAKHLLNQNDNPSLRWNVAINIPEEARESRSSRKESWGFRRLGFWRGDSAGSGSVLGKAREDECLVEMTESAPLLSAHHPGPGESSSPNTGNSLTFVEDGKHERILAQTASTASVERSPHPHGSPSSSDHPDQSICEKIASLPPWQKGTIYGFLAFYTTYLVLFYSYIGYFWGFRLP
ncbi:uncharacterized protein PGTG_21409 [Puccinia graminis f. sp. tritici CRL 75-36-700-3]|uniref:Uncharacterized protein n=1 Tax=Puccinia graminis f. sp. tritici (strain CRL 75-36-700-3 / race SCCL) TaxID=418459 RepID=H6QR87_PUCGT|nr:uncharacterized protein PGTG_21409 [Puccinia graminis f. sp. tritici CRL 75-36-700-3]EHS63069.1 hypothetical protein PGTG_21409 [Puccinia graminis f. sp. tritici CRL 75-36-700-3]